MSKETNSKEKLIKAVLKKNFKKSELSSDVFEISKGIGLVSEKKYFSAVKKSLKQKEKELNILKNDIALLKELEKQEKYASYAQEKSDSE